MSRHYIVYIFYPFAEHHQHHVFRKALAELPLSHKQHWSSMSFFWVWWDFFGKQCYLQDFSYTREIMTKMKTKKTPNSYKCKRCIEKELKFTCQRTYSILQVALYFQCFSLIDPLTHLCSTLNNVLTNQNYIFLTIIQSPAFVSHLQASSSMLAKSAFWTTCVVKQEQDLSTFFFFFLGKEVFWQHV